MKAALLIFLLTGNDQTTLVDRVEYNSVSECMMAAYDLNADQSDNHKAGACLPLGNRDDKID